MCLARFIVLHCNGTGWIKWLSHHYYYHHYQYSVYLHSPSHFSESLLLSLLFQLASSEAVPIIRGSFDYTGLVGISKVSVCFPRMSIYICVSMCFTYLASCVEVITIYLQLLFIFPFLFPVLPSLVDLLVPTHSFSVPVPNLLLLVDVDLPPTRPIHPYQITILCIPLIVYE